MAILLPSMLLTMRRLWRDWTYLYGHTRLYPSKGAAASEQRSEQRCQLLARVRARASEKRPQNPTYLVHSTRLGSSIFARARSVILLRHSPTIIITNGQQRQRAEAAGRDGGSRGNKMQLVREKIDDVVVRAPAPAKATVGHTHTYTLPHTHTYINTLPHSLTHTHAHLCAAWTQKSFASLKSLALSLLLLSPALSLSLSLFRSSLAFIFDVSSPQRNHLSPCIHLARFLLLQAYRLTHAHAHAHILSTCVCVCGLSYDLKDIGYRIGVWIMNSS